MNKRKTRTKVKSTPAKAARPAAPGKGATQSKASTCIGLLSRKEGASIVELQKATGWQPHSVRGFLSSKVKNAPGFKLSSEKTADGERRYHVKSA